MTEFETYQPEAWFYDGLIVASDFDALDNDAPTEKRSAPWDVSIPGRLIAAGVFSASALLFGATSAAANQIDHIPVPGLQMAAYVLPPKPVTLSPLHEINRSFNKLFDDMRAGTKVVALADMRALAQKAVQLRDEKVDVDSWARRLSDDVKNADD